MFDRTDQRYLKFRELTEAAFDGFIEDLVRKGEALEVALDDAVSRVQSASVYGFEFFTEPRIPEFREGVLPATHLCSADQFQRRFGVGNARREQLLEQFLRLLTLAKRANARRLLIGGSFIDEVQLPDDLDVVILILHDQLRSKHGRRLLELYNKGSADGIDLKLEATEAGWWGWYRLLGKLRDPSPGYRGLVEILL